MSPHSPGDWKHIAEQASQENGLVKAAGIVNEPNRALGEHEETSRLQRCQGNQQVQAKTAVFLVCANCPKPCVVEHGLSEIIAARAVPKPG